MTLKPLVIAYKHACLHWDSQKLVLQGERLQKEKKEGRINYKLGRTKIQTRSNNFSYDINS